MRILLVHNYYQQRGGEDVVVDQESDLLRQKGHTVEVFSVTNHAIHGAWKKATVAAQAVYNRAAKAELGRKLQAFRPDVVHAHNLFPQLSPSVFDACREAGVATVMTCHNFRILCPTSNFLYRGRIEERSLRQSAIWALPHRVYRNSFFATLPLVASIDYHKWAGTWRRKVDRFIALTEFAKGKFIEGGVPAEKIVVKPNAVADPFNGRPVDGGARAGALYVGRLSEEKGVAPLISAWRELDYPLRIAGDGPLRSLCENAQNKHITLLGRVNRDQVYEEMRKASFLVLPSICYDMFPLTLVEAYANGLPVLASKLGGLRSLLDDGVTGLGFEAGDIEDMRTKVRWAAANRDAMLSFGKRARTKYETLYTAEQNYTNLIEVYRQAIAESRKANPRPR